MFNRMFDSFEWPRVFIESPFQIMVCLAMTIVGVAGIVSGTYAMPGTLERGLPDWLQLMWNISLLVGGISSIAGLVKMRTTLESVGLLLLVYGCSVYGIVLAVFNMPQSIVNLSAMVAVVVACGFRLWVLKLARKATYRARQDQE